MKNSKINIKRKSLLSKSEEIKYIKLAKANNLEATEKIMNNNIQIINDILKPFNDKHNYEELLDIGKKGVIKAIEKFNLEGDIDFKTYVGWWIKQYVYRYVKGNPIIKNKK